MEGPGAGAVDASMVVIGSPPKACGVDVRSGVDLSAGYRAAGLGLEEQALFVYNEEFAANKRDKTAVFGGLDDMCTIAPGADDNAAYFQEMVAADRVFSGERFTLEMMRVVFLTLLQQCSFGLVWAFFDHAFHGWLTFGDERLTAQWFVMNLVRPWHEAHSGKTLFLLVSSCFSRTFCANVIKFAAEELGIVNFHKLVMLSTAGEWEMSYTTRFYRVEGRLGAYCHLAYRVLRRVMIEKRGSGASLKEVGDQVNEEAKHRCLNVWVYNGDGCEARCLLPEMEREGDAGVVKVDGDERAAGSGAWKVRELSGVPLAEELRVADGQGGPIPEEVYRGHWAVEGEEVRGSGELVRRGGAEMGKVTRRCSFDDLLKRMQTDARYMACLGEAEGEISEEVLDGFEWWLYDLVWMQPMSSPVLRVFGRALLEDETGLKAKVREVVEQLAQGGV